MHYHQGHTKPMGFFCLSIDMFCLSLELQWTLPLPASVLPCPCLLKPLLPTRTLFQFQALTLILALGFLLAMKLVVYSISLVVYFPWHSFRIHILMFSFIATIEISKWSCIYLNSFKTFGLAAHLIPLPPCWKDEGDFQLRYIRGLVCFVHYSYSTSPESSITFGLSSDSATICCIT